MNLETNVLGWRELPPDLAELKGIGVEGKIIEWEHTGSTAIVGHGADRDYMALVAPLCTPEPIRDALESAGWSRDCKGCRYVGDFESFRKGDVNLILFVNELLYREKLAAFRICRYLHKTGLLSMHDKDLRVRLHKIASDELPNGGLD